VSDEAAVSVPDGSGFSVESLISEATKAWDEPDDTPPGSDTAAPDTESPEGASAESPPQEQSSTEVVADRGDGRDSKGRFAPKGEAQEQDAGAKAPDAVPPSPTAEPQAEATPQTPPGTEEAVADQPQPFSVRFAGQDYAIPGAVRTANHIVIPADQESAVSRLIGRGLKYDATEHTLKEEKSRLAIQQEMFAAETGPVMEEVKRLFEIAGLPDENQFAEAFTKYAWELRQSLPLLRERMDLSKQRQEIEIQRRMSAPDPEVQAAQLAEGAVTTAQQHLSQWRSNPQVKSMTDDDWGWINNRVARDPAAFLARAGERLTPEEEQAGVRPGEVYFSTDKLLGLVNDRFEWRSELVHRDTEARKAIEQAKSNAVKLANGTVPPPPTGAADSAQRKDEDEPKVFTSLDDLKKDLGVFW
jgi:hypothetical protein